MVREFNDWLQANLNGYSPQYGQWNDSGASDSSKYAAIMLAAGPAPVVDVRKPVIRLILLGRKGTRADAPTLLDDINTLIQSAIDGTHLPCGLSAIFLVSEPVGPGYTIEDRAWVQADFEVIF